MGTSRSHSGRVAVGAGLAALLVSLAGCSGDDQGSSPTPAETTSPFRFTEEAETRGVTGPHAPFRLRMSPSMNGGAAMEDLDGDGDLDIYRTLYNQPNQVLLNDGTGQFAPPEKPTGLEVEGASGTPLFADFDGDRDLDAFVAPTNYGRPYLLSNEGGSWVDVTEQRGISLESRDAFGEHGSFAYGASAFDFDHDGDLDIVAGEWGRIQNVHRLTDTHRAYAFVNDGKGVFVDQTDALGLAVLRDVAVFGFSWLDLDGDGWEDLLVAGDFGTSTVLTSRKGTYFADVTTNYLPPPVRGDATSPVSSGERLYNAMGSTLADLVPGDDKLEWVVSAIGAPPLKTNADRYGCGENTNDSEAFDAGLVIRCTGNRVLTSKDGTFVDSSEALGVRNSGWGWGVVAQDLDMDGLVDLAVTNGYVAEFDKSVKKPTVVIDGEETDLLDLPVYRRADSDVNTLWHGASGSSEWIESSVAAGFGSSQQGRALVPGDIDRDGDLDILQINNGEGVPELFINHADPPSESWVGIRSIDIKDAPAGCVGCTVAVAASGTFGQQTRVITGSGSYASDDPDEALFAVSEGTGPVEATIVTPGGKKQVVALERGKWTDFKP